MLFDFEPSGVNDTYLRLSRSGGTCILGPAGVWNGLLRLNYIVAGLPAGSEPYMIVRALDVGFDDGRFYWKGRAGPVTTTPAMVDALVDRGLITAVEGERLLFGNPAGATGGGTDEALMLRAVLGGATFTPVYGGEPPAVAGYALRTLAESDVHVLAARDGLPVLDAAGRAALRRQIGGR